MLTNSLRRDDVIPFNGNLVRPQHKAVVVPLHRHAAFDARSNEPNDRKGGLLLSAAKRPPISTSPWRCLLPMP